MSAKFELMTVKRGDSVCEKIRLTQGGSHDKKRMKRGIFKAGVLENYPYTDHPVVPL